MTSARALVSSLVRAEEPVPPEVFRLLKEQISVDVHSHGGPSGISSPDVPGPVLAASMRAGGLAAVCFAEVPDGPLLGRDPSGLLKALRAPEPGELYKFHLGRMEWTDALVATCGMRRALSLADLWDAHAKGQPALIQDIEGLDFLEGKLERLEECYRRGVRKVQLVHYTPNEIGDFQTGEIRHHGLTSFGADVIRTANRLGFVVDVAHGTEDMVRQAVRVASRPLLLSHTAIRGSKAQGKTPLAERQVTPAHAKLVADTGGAIGIWHFFPSLEDYVAGIREMVDVVGVEHVCIGTDTSRNPGLFATYEPFSRLVNLLLESGFGTGEAAKLVGGNFLRVFGAATGAT